MGNINLFFLDIGYVGLKHSLYNNVKTEDNASPLRDTRDSVGGPHSKGRNGDIIPLEQQRGVWLVRKHEMDRTSSEKQFTINDEYDFYGRDGLYILKRDFNVHFINKYV